MVNFNVCEGSTQVAASANVFTASMVKSMYESGHQFLIDMPDYSIYRLYVTNIDGNYELRLVYWVSSSNVVTLASWNVGGATRVSSWAKVAELANHALSMINHTYNVSAKVAALYLESVYLVPGQAGPAMTDYYMEGDMEMMDKIAGTDNIDYDDIWDAAYEMYQALVAEYGKTEALNATEEAINKVAIAMAESMVADVHDEDEVGFVTEDYTDDEIEWMDEVMNDLGYSGLDYDKIWERFDYWYNEMIAEMREDGDIVAEDDACHRVWDDIIAEADVVGEAKRLTDVLRCGYSDYNAMMMWRQHSSQIIDPTDIDTIDTIISAIDDFGYLFNDCYHALEDKTGMMITIEDGFVMPLDDWWFNAEGTDVAECLDDLINIQEWLKEMKRTKFNEDWDALSNRWNTLAL